MPYALKTIREDGTTLKMGGGVEICRALRCPSDHTTGVRQCVCVLRILPPTL